MPISLPNPPRVPGLVLGTSPYALGDVAWRSPGATNLLTSNQASLETDTTGWQVDSNTAITRSTAQYATGSASLLMTSVAAGNQSAKTPATIPVSGGRTYQFVASFLTPGGVSAARVYVYWYTAGGSFISQSTSTAVTTATGTWVEARTTDVAPATAAYAQLIVRQDAASGANVLCYVDKVGLWEGPGGSWALPGEPIQGLGTWVDESVGRRCFAWDPINSRWQMTYGDTGIRNITAALNSTSGLSITGAYIRRFNSTVTIWLSGVAYTSRSNFQLYATPAGFHPELLAYETAVGTRANALSVTDCIVGVAQAGAFSIQCASNNAFGFSMSWQTTDAWPTVLPGSASGSIPSG